MQTRTRLFPQGERYDRGGLDKGPLPLCHEEAFQEVIRREAIRRTRSGTFPLLLLFDVAAWGSTEMTRKIASVLSSSTREIDVKGWYADGAIMGILFTELGRMQNAVDAAREAILARLRRNLSDILTNEDMRRMKVTSHLLPGMPANQIAQRGRST